MTPTNKRLLISESHGDSNRCIPYSGKSDQHATRFPRMVQDHTYLTWSKYSNPSRVIDTVRQSHCSRETGLLTRIHNTPADRSVGPHLVSLPSQPTKQWRKPNIYRQQATRLARPINTSIRLVRSILARGGQPNGP
jgi:hypothetical protein